jgi:Rieske Fe-S protein
VPDQIISAEARDSRTPTGGEPRRNFVTKALATVIGGVIGLVPFVAGLFTFFDPLRARGTNASGANKGRLIRVAPLSAVPADGVPRQFPVIADKDDAWNRFPDQAIGAVFLRRTSPDSDVQAFNATCPHAGCFVAYRTDREVFVCPCHASAFGVDGEMIQPTPSPRALDTLDSEIRDVNGQQEIWVWFQDFCTGIAKKKPKI